MREDYYALIVDGVVTQVGVFRKGQSPTSYGIAGEWRKITDTSPRPCPGWRVDVEGNWSEGDG